MLSMFLSCEYIRIVSYTYVMYTDINVSVDLLDLGGIYRESFWMWLNDS